MFCASIPAFSFRETTRCRAIFAEQRPPEQRVSVSNFDRLHPALQHHIVNSLGWRELRPFQEAVIGPILAGKHLIVLAPTAGGKTEAAFFPVVSRMLTEDWRGLSVLYICPIKALLNNLDLRLQRYCTLLGRRSALWHGDIKSSARKRILREPPDCLLLATKDETLVQAAGVIDLWAEGYVEPIEPPPLPLHVLAQQLMALTLQERGIGREDWLGWVRAVPGFGMIPSDYVQRLVAWMLQREILWDEAGILAMGREGEDKYGRRNFLELFSVFMSPPLFSILHGRQELGYVDETTFLGKHEGPRVLLLGGRCWKVNHIDWQRRIAHVEATELTGRSRWKGEGRGLGFRLSQTIKRILATDEGCTRWSRRATERMGEIRQEFPWLRVDSSAAVLAADGKTEWWTFGGNRANATLARQLARETASKVSHDSFTLNFDSAVKLQDVERAIAQLRQRDATDMRPAIDEAAIDGLKFSECLPTELAIEMLELRLREPTATQHILKEDVRFLVR